MSDMKSSDERRCNDVRNLGCLLTDPFESCFRKTASGTMPVVIAVANMSKSPSGASVSESSLASIDQWLSRRELKGEADSQSAIHQSVLVRESSVGWPSSRLPTFGPIFPNAS